MVQPIDVDSSHEHSLITLEKLYDHDDFMASIGSVCDMGCGSGKDIQWWATRETRDDTPIPHEYNCFAVDLDIRQVRYNPPKNIHLIEGDFDDNVLPVQVDLIWSHDSFGYSRNPLATLKKWWHDLLDGGMLCLILPQMMNIEYNRPVYQNFTGQYYNYNVINLVYMLATSGFDCADGHFYKRAGDPWLHALVYKSEVEPQDPKTVTWYSLAEQNLLPVSFARSIQRRGYPVNSDILLPWIDGTLTDFSFDR